MDLQQLQEIMKSISDVGTSVLVIGIFVMYLKNHFDNRKKSDDYELQRLQDNDKQQVARAEKWEDIIASLVVEKMQNHEDHLKEEPRNSGINNNIMEAMTAELRNTGASHILHFSYHNGGKDYEGRSYQRMSCINEVSGSNVSPIQSKFNDMFRTGLFYIYQELITNRFFNIDDIETLRDRDGGTYYALAQDGIRAAYGCGIHNKNGDVIGFLMACYDHKLEDNKNAISSLKKCAYQIEGIYLTQ